MRSSMYKLEVNGVWKISSVACGFSSIKIDYSDYPKSLIRINKGNVFFIKISLKHKHLSHLFCCNYTCYCVNTVSVTTCFSVRSQRDDAHVCKWFTVASKDMK